MAYQPNFYNPYMMNQAFVNQQQRLQQQMEQQMYQPQIMQQQIPSINGRIIDDISTVTANEVSMDGSLSVFPTRDLSAIYCRQWQNDGTIKTVKFIPFVEEIVNSTEENKNVENDRFLQLEQIFNARFDSIESKLEQMDVGISKKETTSRTKKAGE